MIIKQLTVFLENKTGRLNELIKILAENDINISALSLAETADYGTVRMIVGRPQLAETVLRQAHFSVGLKDVAGVIVPDQPGGLHQVLQILTDNNIDVHYMYGFSNKGSALIVIRAASIERVIEVLQAHKLELLQSSQIYQV